MTTIWHRYADGAEIGFTRGRFDDWCVYFHDGEHDKYMLDKEYFKTMQVISEKYPTVWDDFCVVYNLTEKAPDERIFNVINLLSKKYGEYQEQFEKERGVIYMGMIAEENKENAILGKKVKYIGMYQTLKLGWDVEKSANFSKGVKYTSLSVLYSLYSGAKRALS